jgi:hypothetical protein
MLGVVFATFSLRRELPDMVLGDEPLLSQGGRGGGGGFLHHHSNFCTKESFSFFHASSMKDK